jgi:phosphatidylglycerophosphate synthase
MRKIPRNLENPIDNLLIDLAEPLSVVFKAMNFTPNGITTLSLIFGILSVIGLYKGYAVFSVIMMSLSYLMDCCDGYYARKYNMVTKGGDFYDHIKDITVFSSFIYVLYMRNKDKLNLKEWIIVLSVLVFFLIMSVLYFACQERYYGKEDEIPTLGKLSGLIPTKEKAETCLKVLRFFGLGTFNTVVFIFTIWIERKE